MYLSVLLPAFNAERHLAEALSSVLAQTHSDFELLVINDGSTDRTLEIAQRFCFRDPRVKIFSHANIGMGASLNQALEWAESDWIVRMDADDVMLSNRLERQIAFVEEHPWIAAAGSLVYYIGEDGKILGSSTSELATPADLRRSLKSSRPIALHHPSVILRRDVVLEAGGYRPQFWPADDFDLWARLAEEGQLILVQQEYLLQYRIHGGSTSISNAAEASRQVRWAKECASHRRRGLHEPTFAEFEEIEQSRPFWSRWHRKRQDLSKVLFRQALSAYSERRYLQAAANFAASGVLRPGFVLPRLYSRFLAFRWRTPHRLLHPEWAGGRS